MSKPMSAKQFVDLLDKWSIPHRAYRNDWDTHNRNSKGKWDDVNGVMIHHTGSDNQKSMPKVLWDGYESLPGPLCHGGIDVKGTVWLIGWGRANHAGGGDPDVLKHVINENYSGVLKPKYTNTSGIDGNRHFYGFEIMYSGSHAMSPEQMRTSTMVAAAICKWHKWGRLSVIGHGEWQLGKWDPGVIKNVMTNMSAYREVVNLHIKAGPPIIPKNGTYKIKSGDSLYKIARDVLGDERRWVDIVALNRNLFPLTLLPGSVIKLPKK